ncbi:MAG: OsmC family protein [Acidobacteriaceae bacterium]
MELTVKHLGEVQFEIKARQHTIISDQPEDGGGFDEGMTPPELLLASLGSCAAFYAAEYLRRHGLAEEGLTVSIHAEKVKNPARIENFHIAITSPVPLPQEHLAGMHTSAHRCLIHNTLLHPPKIEIVVENPAGSLVQAS